MPELQITVPGLAAGTALAPQAGASVGSRCGGRVGGIRLRCHLDSTWTSFSFENRVSGEGSHREGMQQRVAVLWPP